MKNKINEIVSTFKDFDDPTEKLGILKIQNERIFMTHSYAPF